MMKRSYMCVLMSLVLVLVSSVSVSFAAGGGSGHEVSPHDSMMKDHHETVSQTKMIDCPAHHDGHSMKDAQCAVACFTLVSAVVWQTSAFPLQSAIAEQDISSAEQFYPTRAIHIPTPPPDFV